MRSLLAVAITLAFAGAAASLRAQPAKDGKFEAKAARIAVLIRQLDDADFAKRQAAGKELESMGKAAIAPLRKAAASSDSVEVRQRAERLIRVLQGTTVTLNSGAFSPGLPLAESKYPIYSVHITANVDTKGEGEGKITLVSTAPNYDEYGDFVTGTEVDLVDRSRKEQHPPHTLDCAIEYIKTGFVGRVNTPGTNRSVFRVKGPKITSQLVFVTTGPGLTSGRLLVLGKDSRVDHVVEMYEHKPFTGKPIGEPIPCHPGCFPAGTLVHVPDGGKRIETLRKGDTVTTIADDGKAGRGVIQEVFISKNRLVKVRTDHGTLTTTEAQPLCLIDGTFRRAGDLEPGDRIWQWRNGRRTETVVREISPPGAEAQVFNLILGDSAIFVAGDFLARGKPPAVGAVAEVVATPPMSGSRRR